ncbi:hypothetical protein PISMIDRAFT_17980 [Pisolithus microcarpus 441]|uniref:Uncharacterized protein n=1 Tax=Pisolithus microcarpus 441 TaxID=765257 RepID=A0A0C9YI36_9AGAM|nr:hypothetical protein PISMIDRAFT_17980 [Pisolithus microcarpus 441]
MNNEHENTAATEDRWPPSAGGSHSRPLKNTAPTSFSQIPFQDKPDSVHFESTLPLQDVAPVPQADGSHKSDKDTPHQKDVSSGSLNIWPDGTISFGDSAHAEFDFDAHFDHSETPSLSNQRGSVQPSSILINEGNTKGHSTATDEPTFVVGRTPASIAALLEEGFDHINDEFNTLSGQVRMPIQQVIQCFTQQYACSNSANEWNTYQQYFAAHKAQELQRLQGGENVTGMPSEKMSKCYKLFCKQFPDTYKQILAVYKDTVILGNTDKTVAQCQQLFHNTSKQLVQLFNSIAKCHAFEGAFLLAGSVINQDGGLGYMHTTPNAENFFLEWCHADEDKMSTDGLHFVVKLDAHDALYYSWSPVIYGTPPDSDLKHAFAKRMYANLKCDHNGAAHKSSASATHLKKKKTGKSTCDVEVISIPDSDEIMPNAVPHTKVKHPAPSVDDSDEIEEIPLVVRKSTWLQPRVMIVQPTALKKHTRQVVKSDKNDDDSVNIGDLEYNPDDKASGDEGSDPEEARVADEGNVLEDKRQSSSCKHKCTFDNTGCTSKRLAINPKPVK